jgi:hypothetical protein
MFVATTLALSLVFSPVTALTQAPAGPANTTTPAAAPATTAATPAATPATPASKPAAAPASKPATTSKPAGSSCEKLDYRARVDVDASALGADGQGVATRLRTKVEQELRGNDFMLGAAGDAIPQMTVKVVSLPGEDEGYKYTIDITHVDASPIKDGSSVGECPLCTESELLEKVVGAARALAPKLRAYVADYNNKPCVTACTSDAACKNPAEPHCNLQKSVCEAAPSGCRSDAECPAAQHCMLSTHICVDDGTSTDPPPPGGLSSKQKAGVALLAVGAVGVGVGIGLMVKKPVAENPAEAWSYTTTKPPGIALLAVGGVAVATGVVLFILGRRPPRNQIAPVAGAGFYGLSWSGRF